MNLFENLEKAIEKTLESDKKHYDNNKIENFKISKNELELANKLDAIEEFTIDRFEDNIVVLENRNTQEMINLKRSELPEGINTGDIIKRINGKFFIDDEKTKVVSERIKNKINDLWN